MKNQKKLSALAFFIAVTATGNAQASLTNVGNGLVYDSNINMTFTGDANLFKTLAASTLNLVSTITNASGLSSGQFNASTGQMDWFGAQAWISYLNTINYAGHTNWNLPTTNLVNNNISLSNGYSQTGSPLGELFYSELGGEKNKNITATHNDNFNLFSNVPVSTAYWSGKSNSDTAAWYFDYTNGNQAYTAKTNMLYVLPVFASEVSVSSAIPVPGAIWLFGSGLIALLSFIKRRNF